MRFDFWFDHGESKSREDLEKPEFTCVADSLDNAIIEAAEQLDPHDSYTTLHVQVNGGAWFRTEIIKRGWRISSVVASSPEDAAKYFEADL